MSFLFEASDVTDIKLADSTVSELLLLRASILTVMISLFTHTRKNLVSTNFLN